MILASWDEPFCGRYYYIQNGLRRWIESEQDALFYGIDISAVNWTDRTELSKYPKGANIVGYPEKLENALSTMQARAFMAKNLKGEGVEFGPGITCHPLPLNCRVSYADLFHDNEGCKKHMGGGRQEFPFITYYTGIDEMTGIADESLDFIICDHIIEHSRNPIKALFTSWRKLKKNGILLMAVPDKRLTFDKKRKTTSLAHLVKDYQKPSKLRDYFNIVDYVINTGNCNIKETLLFLMGIGVDIHFHTFTPKNFEEILNWSKERGLVWTRQEIIPALNFAGANEFYVRLEK